MSLRGESNTISTFFCHCGSLIVLHQYYSGTIFQITTIVHAKTVLEIAVEKEWS